jgi:chromosome segregation ATPase
MASKIAEKAPSWVTRILLPEIAEMKGELKNLNTKLDELDKRLTGKIDSNFGSLSSKMDSNYISLDSKIDSISDSLSSKIDSLRNELKSDISRVDSRIEDLDKRLDIVQRLSVLEAKVRESEDRHSHGAS